MSKMIETLHRSHRGHRTPRHAISRRTRNRQPAIARSGVPQGLKLQSEVAEALSNQIVPPKSELSPQVRPLPQFLKLDHQTLATYRGLFRRIGNSLDLSQSRSICITSAAAGEGKTTTAISLAFVAAQHAERRVLVIDANFVSPQVADRLGFQQKLGLFDALQDGVFPAEAIRESLPVGYDVLPAGQFDDRAADLLCGRRMGVLLWDLKQSYDLIIVDAPHVRDQSVARMFAQYFDAVFLAVKMLETRREIIDSALSLLHRAGAAIQGCILTQKGAVQDLECAISELELASARAAEPQDEEMVFPKSFDTLAATATQLPLTSKTGDGKSTQVGETTTASTAGQPTSNSSTPPQAAPTQPETKTPCDRVEQIATSPATHETPAQAAPKEPTAADTELPLSIVWNQVAPIDSDCQTWAAALQDLSLTISALGNSDQEHGVAAGNANPLTPEVTHSTLGLSPDSCDSADTENDGECSDGYVWVADRTDFANHPDDSDGVFADGYDEFSCEAIDDEFSNPTEMQFETIIDLSSEADVEIQLNETCSGSDSEPCAGDYRSDPTSVSTHGFGFGPTQFESETLEIQSEEAPAEYCMLVDSQGGVAETFGASESSSAYTEPSLYNSQVAAWSETAGEAGDDCDETQCDFTFSRNYRDRDGGPPECDTLRKLETIHPFEATETLDPADQSDHAAQHGLLSELVTPLEASAFPGNLDVQTGLATVSPSSSSSEPGELDRDTFRRIQVHRPTLMSLQSSDQSFGAIGVRETKPAGAKESWAANVLAVCGGLLILAGIFYVAVDVAIWF